MHQKTCVASSSDPGLRRIQCCMVLHHSEVMVSVSNASCIVYLFVRCAFEHRHINLNKADLYATHVCQFVDLFEHLI